MAIGRDIAYTFPVPSFPVIGSIGVSSFSLNLRHDNEYSANEGALLILDTQAVSLRIDYIFPVSRSLYLVVGSSYLVFTSYFKFGFLATQSSIYL